MVVNPADIPTTYKERVQKEDKRDSRKIARSLSSGELTPIYIPSIQTQEDRTLLRTRAMLIKDLTRIKHRIKSFLYYYGFSVEEVFPQSQSHWSNRFISWLEGLELSGESGKQSLQALIDEFKHLRISTLEITRQIRHLAQSDTYSDKVDLLRTVPGIGLITAMTFLTELETINRFSSLDKLCSYIGLVPSTRSSGDKEKPGDITPRGHDTLRSALIESSWIAIRNDPSLMKSFLSYQNRMEPNKAIIRIAKKLLSRIRFVLQNNEPYKCMTP